MLPFVFFMCSVVIIHAEYIVPEATVEAFYPNGLRVSIPDEEGIKLFAFHAKINEELNGREGGTFSRDITKAKNGRWTFYDPYAKLNKGDILYYWTYVDYFDGRNKLGYTNDDNEFVIKELLAKPGKPTVAVTPMTPPNYPTKTETTAPSCEPSETTIGNRKTCGDKLIFNEDFSQGIQDNLWTVEQRYANSPDYEFVMYMNRQEALQVTNGHLGIQPILSEDVFGSGFVTSPEGFDFNGNCTGVPGVPNCKRKYDAGFYLPPVISSQISTRGKFSFKYGKIEIRAKLPKGDWIYPELFLNPVNEDYGPDYQSGQIRVAFVPGNAELDKVLHGGVIIGSNSKCRKYGMKNIEQTIPWSEDYHRFAVTWKPDSIVVSVDNRIYGIIEPPPDGFSSLGANLDIPDADKWKRGSKLAPFDKEMYISIGVGVGGFSFEDREDGSKPWKTGERLIHKKFYNAKHMWKRTWDERSSLKVDYVKVWSL